MIEGQVNAELEAVIRLQIRNASHSLEVRGVIDTGFSGDLTAPQSLIDQLELPWIKWRNVELADGQIVLCAVYEAELDWDGASRVIEIDSAETTPLVGMSLLQDRRLTIQVTRGGFVRIEKL
jgi:clan AA aspartic protease